MNRPLVRWLLRACPPAWRERYGEEFKELLHAGPGGLRTVLDVLRSGLRERCSPARAGLVPGGVPGSLLAFAMRPSAFLPMAMSIAALTVVLVDIGAFGVPPPHADEGAAAHTWQLLMMCQLPEIAWFAFRWRRTAPRLALGILGIQLMLFIAAVAPVYVFGL